MRQEIVQGRNIVSSLPVSNQLESQEVSGVKMLFSTIRARDTMSQSSLASPGRATVQGVYASLLSIQTVSNRLEPSPVQSRQPGLGLDLTNPISSLGVYRYRTPPLGTFLDRHSGDTMNSGL